MKDTNRCHLTECCCLIYTQDFICWGLSSTACDVHSCWIVQGGTSTLPLVVTHTLWHTWMQCSCHAWKGKFSMSLGNSSRDFRLVFDTHSVTFQICTCMLHELWKACITSSFGASMFHKKPYLEHHSTKQSPWAHSHPATAPWQHANLMRHVQTAIFGWILAAVMEHVYSGQVTPPTSGTVVRSENFRLEPRPHFWLRLLYMVYKYCQCVPKLSADAHSEHVTNVTTCAT